LAEITNSKLTVSAIPLRHEEIARYATKEYLVENATASLNGCHLIVAAKNVSDLIVEELRKHNFAPARIGPILGKGVPSVAFDAQQKIEEYAASKTKLARLTSPPVQPTVS
jgi:hypothetical protein